MSDAIPKINAGISGTSRGFNALRTFLARYWIALLFQVVYLGAALWFTCGTCLNGPAGSLIAGTDTTRFHCADFPLYYYTAWEAFKNGGLSRIYDFNYMDSTYGVYMFRYLPSFIFLAYPLILVDIQTAYSLFTMLSFCANVGTLWFLIKITSFLKLSPQQSRTWILLYFCLPFQYTNYTWGQMSSFISLLLLVALYCFLKQHDVLGCLFLGISIVIKPVCIFVIILVLLKNFKWQTLLKRGIIIGIVLVPDALIFLQHPELISSYLAMTRYCLTVSTLRATVSFANALYVLNIPSPEIWVPMLAVVTMSASLWVGRKVKESRDCWLFSFIIGIEIYFVSQPDIWMNQFGYFFVLLAIFTLYYIPAQASGFKKWVILYAVGDLIVSPAIYLHEAFNVPFLPEVIIFTFALLPLYFWLRTLIRFRKIEFLPEHPQDILKTQEVTY